MKQTAEKAPKPFGTRCVRNCNGCKAYYQSQYKYSCDLGYAIEVCRKKKMCGTTVPTHKPITGFCPKPKTIKELCNAPRACC